MRSVIEAAETVAEEYVEQSHATLPPIAAPRLGFITKTIALPRNLEPFYKRHFDRQGPRREEGEMPLDMSAREHPYMHIIAMAV